MNFISKSFSELTPFELYDILKARAEVFMLEQNIRCLDMDGVDPDALHCFFKDEGEIVAYLRVYPIERDAVKIGRVLCLRRGCGIGRELVEKSLAAAYEKWQASKTFVDAQLQAQPFYEKCGFVPVSDVFMEEGIPHVKMEKLR